MTCPDFLEIFTVIEFNLFLSECVLLLHNGPPGRHLFSRMIQQLSSYQSSSSAYKYGILRRDTDCEPLNFEQLVAGVKEGLVRVSVMRWFLTRRKRGTYQYLATTCPSRQLRTVSPSFECNSRNHFGARKRQWIRVWLLATVSSNLLIRDQLKEYNRSRDTYFTMRSHALFVVVIEYTWGELMFAEAEEWVLDDEECLALRDLDFGMR